MAIRDDAKAVIFCEWCKRTGAKGFEFNEKVFVWQCESFEKCVERQERAANKARRAKKAADNEQKRQVHNSR